MRLEKALAQSRLQRPERGKPHLQRRTPAAAPLPSEKSWWHRLKRVGFCLSAQPRRAPSFAFRIKETTVAAAGAASGLRESFTDLSSRSRASRSLCSPCAKPSVVRASLLFEEKEKRGILGRPTAASLRLGEALLAKRFPPEKKSSCLCRTSRARRKKSSALMSCRHQEEFLGKNALVENLQRRAALALRRRGRRERPVFLG